MRKFGTVLTLCAALFATYGQAQCMGQDLRGTLSDADRASLDTQLEALPFAAGNHWRAMRDGQIVHLVGTIHIDDPRLDGVTTRLRGVIENSELLLLEMTPAEEELLQKDMSQRPELLFLQDATLPELLPEAEWAELAQAAEERGIPAMIASRFQPWYMSVLLAMPPCLTAAMAGTPNGLDHRFMKIAEKADIDMKALEPHDTLFTLFNDAPLEEQIDVMMLGLKVDANAEDMLASLREAYFEERHGEAWEMSRLQMMAIEGETPERLTELFGEMEDDLLFARNQAWIPVILEALEGRSVITVAAGAGHLNGALGLLSLLELEGFDVERLPF